MRPDIAKWPIPIFVQKWVKHYIVDMQLNMNLKKKCKCQRFYSLIEWNQILDFHTESIHISNIFSCIRKVYKNFSNGMTHKCPPGKLSLYLHPWSNFSIFKYPIIGWLKQLFFFNLQFSIWVLFTILQTSKHYCPGSPIIIDECRINSMLLTIRNKNSYIKYTIFNPSLFIRHIKPLCLKLTDTLEDIQPSTWSPLESETGCIGSSKNTGFSVLLIDKKKLIKIKFNSSNYFYFKNFTNKIYAYIFVNPLSVNSNNFSHCRGISEVHIKSLKKDKGAYQ